MVLADFKHSECTASRSVFRMSTRWGSLFYSWIIFYVISRSRIRPFFFPDVAYWVYGVLLWRVRALHVMWTCRLCRYPENWIVTLAWKEPHHSLGSTIRVSNNSVWEDVEGFPLKAARWKQFPFCSSYRRFAGFLRLSLAGQWRWQNASRPRTKTQLSSPHLQNRTGGGMPLVCRGVAGILQVLFQTEPLQKHPGPRQ